MSIRVGRKRLGEDVDEIAVLRAVQGDEIQLNPTEGELAIAELHRRGMSDGQIAAHLRITDRTVLRVRQRLSLPANFYGKRPIWLDRKRATA